MQRNYFYFSAGVTYPQCASYSENPDHAGGGSPADKGTDENKAAFHAVPKRRSWQREAAPHYVHNTKPTRATASAQGLAAAKEVLVLVHLLAT